MASPLAEEPRHLAEILVATTWYCNLRCNYCFVDQQALGNLGAPMSGPLAARVVDAMDEAFSDWEQISFHLYGGEPLTNLPAMRAMVTQAATRAHGRVRFAITTNGTVDDPEVFSLLEAGRFQVILSLDGPAPVHDACRRTQGNAPTHARVMAFLARLRRETQCWVRASAVVRQGWSLREATDYLLSLPVDAIKAQCVRAPVHFPGTLDACAHKTYLADLDHAGDAVILDLEAGRIPRDDRFSARVLQLLTGRARRHFCGAGRSVFGVTPEGSILPCILRPQTDALGHVDTTSPGWFKAAQAWRAVHRTRLTCSACEALSLCGGGCPSLMPICGDGECSIIRKNVEVAKRIYAHFRSRPEKLLQLAGIP